MTIKQFIEKAIEGMICKFFYLLVVLSNGKAMQSLWSLYKKGQKTFRKTVDYEEVLLSTLSMERNGQKQFCATTQRKEDCQATQVFGMSHTKREGVFFKRVQQARMLYAFQSVKKSWKDTVEEKETYHSTYTTYTPLKEKHPVAKLNIQERPLQMRPMYAFKMLPRSRPLSSNILGDISSV